MSQLTYLVLALCLFCTQAKSFNRAECPPKPDGIQIFDVVAYLGDWYNQAVIPYFFQPSNCTCAHARYGNLGDGIVSVYNTQINPEGDFREACGTAFQGDPDNYPGDLVVGFPEARGNTTNYWILDTDYTTYTVVYDCRPAFDDITEYKWILTRDPVPDQATMDIALNVFTSNGISIDDLEYVFHDETCVYESSPSCLED